LSNSESGIEVDVVIFARGHKIIHEQEGRGDTPRIDTNCRRRVITGHVDIIHVVVPWALR